MSFARKVWGLLVGIKDGLSLVFLLLFFGVLFAALTARPSPAQVRDGALLLNLDGPIVEERTEVDPFSALISGQAPVNEYDVQDLVRALDEAAGDERIQAVAIDLTGFAGGGQVHLQEVGAALDRVRAADKPVLAWSAMYADDAMMLAAHASEVWVDPLGGAFVGGPGATIPYFGELLENLKVNARVYKVGTYKAAVEPYSRSDMSAPARENYEALFGALWEEWQANVKKARPKVELERVTGSPVDWIEAANGDLATAALEGGLVDKLGSRARFGERVAELVGTDDWDETPGNFAHTPFDAWLTEIEPELPGQAIGVITIAGEIVDGDAGPGVAGGDRIARLLDEALDDDLAGLVVRVDSPGGSVMASEAIRRAILRHKANDIPIAVSMANLAASGGYWVSTPADRIFAEPETITGSIGIFAVVPTFEDTAADLGVNFDGVQTSVLSGQPNLLSGFPPEVDAILQASVEDGYRDFIARVSQARNLSAAEVDRIGQGRVWDGGTARQIGLVDQYGGLEDALGWVAGQAELEDGDWHVSYLADEPDPFDAMVRDMLSGEEQEAAPADLFALTRTHHLAQLEQTASSVERLMGAQGIQAYCLECPAAVRATHSAVLPRWLEMFARLLR